MRRYPDGWFIFPVIAFPQEFVTRPNPKSIFLSLHLEDVRVAMSVLRTLQNHPISSALSSVKFRFGFFFGREKADK